MRVACYILGSSSLDRKELMEKAGLAPFIVLPGDYDESDEASDPVRLAELLATRKGESVLRRLRNELKKEQFISLLPTMNADLVHMVLITADTIVSLKSETFGKAADEREAISVLRRLQGQVHKLITAYHLQLLEVSMPGGSANPVDSRTGHTVTKVRFAELDDAEIKGYVATGEWKGRAGCYAIQHKASKFIQSIEGSPSGVMGLPVAQVVEALASLGVEALDAMDAMDAVDA